VGTDGILLAPHGSRPFLIPQEKFISFSNPKLEGCNRYLSYPSSSNFLYAGPATESVLLGSLASKFPNQKLEWDAEACKVSNLVEANQHLSINPREGWDVLPAKAAAKAAWQERYLFRGARLGYRKGCSYPLATRTHLMSVRSRSTPFPKLAATLSFLRNHRAEPLRRF